MFAFNYHANLNYIIFNDYKKKTTTAKYTKIKFFKSIFAFIIVQEKKVNKEKQKKKHQQKQTNKH